MSIFYIVSKILTFFITPAGVLFLTLLLAVFVKNSKKVKKITLFGLYFFYFFSCPLIVNEMLLFWEVPPTSISTIKKYKVGIILTGGITNDDRLPHENIYLYTSADRVGQALQLYKAGKIDNILISGGSNNFFVEIKKEEGIEVAKFLMSGGVPKEKIFLELNSHNTRENAVNSSKILKKRFPNQNYLLISSAYHLKRAKACFEKVGIKTTVFGSHYLSHERQWIFSYLLPKESHFVNSYFLLKEWVGYLAYWASGYV